MAHRDPHPPVHAAPAYETTDANIHAISIWTVGVFVTIFGGMAITAAIVFGFIQFPMTLDRTPTQAEYDRTLPPAPRLQVDQVGDLEKFRARETDLLRTYGREPNSGAVRIPIDKAIDIVATRGVLPGAPVPAQPKVEVKTEGAAARR